MLLVLLSDSLLHSVHWNISQEPIFISLNIFVNFTQSISNSGVSLEIFYVSLYGGFNNLRCYFLKQTQMLLRMTRICFSETAKLQKQAHTLWSPHFVNSVTEGTLVMLVQHSSNWKRGLAVWSASNQIKYSHPV